MGTIIRKTAIYSENNPISSVECSRKAAEFCLAEAGIEKADIDLIINTGIYRENNIAEPAMATLIQKSLGVNLDPILNFEGNSTFSFDLNNGAGGVLYAIQVVDAMLRTGKIKNALIVSNDVHPSTRVNPEFPFNQVGSAMLLEQSNNGDGFKEFMFKSSNSTSKDFYTYVSMLDSGDQGRNIMNIKMSKDYIEHLLEFTAHTAGEFIDEYANNGSSVKHIICTMPNHTFGPELARKLNLPDQYVLNIDDDYGDPHTSSLSVAYHIAHEKGLLKKGDKILFVGAGSGLTCACGLYCV